MGAFLRDLLGCQDSGFWSPTIIVDIGQFVLTLLIALLIYFLYQRRQLISEQWRLRKTLADDMQSILSSRSALRRSGPRSAFLEDVEFRAILTPSPPWCYVEDQKSATVAGVYRPVGIERDGHHYHRVRGEQKESPNSEEEFVAPIALQHTLLWFRHVYRAYQKRLFGPDDLRDLWRHILPFAHSGRLDYFNSYFQGGGDIRPICEVIAATLAACLDEHMDAPIEHYQKATEADKQVLRGQSGGGAKVLARIAECSNE